MSHDARLGLIFDMDDTLAATSHIWQQAERRLLASIGSAWDAALAGRYKGMNALDLSAVIHRELGPTVELAALQQRMRGLLIDAFADARIVPMPGSVELVRRAQSRGRLAVASGSPLPVIEDVLDRLGIADAFDVVLSSESIARGKPHPDVFLAAAERLGVDAASCVVFEDSLVGAQAARAAGMTCFVVPSLANPAIDAIATTVYASWHDVGAAHLTQQAP